MSPFTHQLRMAARFGSPMTDGKSRNDLLKEAAEHIDRITIVDIPPGDAPLETRLFWLAKALRGAGLEGWAEVADEAYDEVRHAVEDNLPPDILNS